ncbi:agenet domain-containing protein [Tanacetum coccineum]
METDEVNSVEEKEKLVKEEEKEELEIEDMEEEDFMHYEPKRPKVITFTQDKPQECDEPHMSHMTTRLLKKIGNRKFDVDKYGRKIVTNAQIEIHGYKFGMDLVVDEYEGTDKPSVDVDWLLKQMLKECGDEGVGIWEMIEMGKDSRLKNNKDSKEQNPPPPPPTLTKDEPNSPDSQIIARPNEPLQSLSPMEEARTIKNEVSLDKKRLEEKEEIKEQEVYKIIEDGLPKKMEDPRNYVVPLKINDTAPINALADTKASVSMMPYKLYKVLGLGKACPSNDKLLMANNMMARAYGKVRNVRLQIGFQAYLYYFLVLHIPVDREIPLLVGIPFLHTCGAILDNRKGIMTIDDGVVKHVYHVKKRSKVVKEEDPNNDEDWLNVFEVGCDEKGYPKYGPTLPLFFNIKDEMESALAMEAYFNPFKNILGSMPIQLKNMEWT